MQQLNSHLLLPQPLACLPPCSQQEKLSLQGQTPLWCMHSAGTPSRVLRMPANGGDAIERSAAQGEGATCEDRKTSRSEGSE